MRRSVRRRVMATLAVTLAVTTTATLTWHPGRHGEISGEDLAPVAKWRFKDTALAYQWNLNDPNSPGTMHALDAVDPDWRLVALEGESFYVPTSDEDGFPTGTRLIRYGREDDWVYKWGSGSQTCTPQIVNPPNDPARGYLKHCEVLWRYVNAERADVPVDDDLVARPVPTVWVPQDGRPHWAAYGNFMTGQLVYQQFYRTFPCTAQKFNTLVIPDAVCAAEDTHIDQTHHLASEGQQFTVDFTRANVFSSPVPGVVEYGRQGRSLSKYFRDGTPLTCKKETFARLPGYPDGDPAPTLPSKDCTLATTYGTGQVIAVLSTGYLAHTDLSGKSLAWATGDVAIQATPEQPCGGNLARQGLEVASVAAALTNNDQGIAGVAPETKVTNVPVTQCVGRTPQGVGGTMEVVTPASYANRIRQAAGLPLDDPGALNAYGSNQNPANIVLATTATPGPCPTLVQAAITDLKKHDVLFVAAAGDMNDTGLVRGNAAWPGNCDDAVPVAGHSQTGDPSTLAWANGSGRSNIGSRIAMSAPGQDIWVLTLIGPDERVSSRNGSAYAAAEVAGGAALVKARRPDLTMEQVADCLRQTARYNPSNDRLDMGEGMLDLARAMDCSIARKQEMEENDTPLTANRVDASTTITGKLELKPIDAEMTHAESPSLKVGDKTSYWSTTDAGVKKYHRTDVDIFSVMLPPGQVLRAYFESEDCKQLDAQTESDKCWLEVSAPQAKYRETAAPDHRLRVRNELTNALPVYIALHHKVSPANASNYRAQRYKLYASWRPTPVGSTYY